MATHKITPLVKKLGIKAGYKLFFKNQPDGYDEMLQPLPEKLTIVKRLSKDLDLIHLFVKRRTDLEKELDIQISKIKQNGAIWVSWPKRSSKVSTDITEDTIREVALPMGLVDIKVCAVNEVWSGLKLVIRKAYRN